MPKKDKCVTIPKGQSVQTYTARCNSSDFISSCNKESLVAFLWQSIEANIEGLKTLIGGRVFVDECRATHRDFY